MEWSTDPSKSFGKLLGDSTTCDVVFQVGSQQAMFFGSFVESKEGTKPIPVDVPLAAFQDVMKFVYGHKLIFDGTRAMEIFQFAHQYEMTELETGCHAFLASILDPDNVWNIFEHAIHYHDERLQRQCLVFVCQNATVCFESDNLAPKEALLQVAKRDDLSCPEIEIFNTILRWAEANDKDDAKEIVRHVRFPLISARDLNRIVKPSGMISTKALLEAYSFQGDPDSFDKNEPRFREREKLISCVWDPKYSNSRLEITEMGLNLEKISGGHEWNSSILGTVPNPPSFKIKYITGLCVMIGLAPRERFKLDAYNYTTCGWYFYIYTGTLYSQAGDNNRPYHQKLTSPTVIEVTFNRKQKTISFSFDGESKGVAFTDVDTTKPLYPAIEFYDQGAKVSLLP